MNEHYESEGAGIRLTDGHATINLSPERSAELRKLLARALNTQDPHKAPQWAMWLADKL